MKTIGRRREGVRAGSPSTSFSEVVGSSLPVDLSTVGTWLAKLNFYIFYVSFVGAAD